MIVVLYVVLLAAIAGLAVQRMTIYAQRATIKRNRELIDAGASYIDALRTARESDGTLIEAATCFRIGDLYVEHIVDTDGRDWGWVVSKDGKWEQRDRMGLTRDQAIDHARARNAAVSKE